MRRRKGLTLIELLIVVGIIIGLAAFFFCLFIPIKERALVNYCINNLKQVGMALHMYAEDHDGFVPPYTNFVMDTGSYPFFPNSNDPALFEAAYEPYTKDKQIWYCPRDPFAGMDTPEMPEGYGPPTWVSEMWGTINHKATSYYIPEACALRGFAPIHISTPLPKKLQVVWRPGEPPEEFIVPEFYAKDYTNSVFFKYYIGILLLYDGSVEIVTQNLRSRASRF